MSTATAPQPRDIRPEDAEAMHDCLVWLGEDDRFIEDYTGDIHEDIMRAFNDTLPHPGIKHRTGTAVIAFLRWMDGGDRLRREHDTPHGPIISFSHSDAPSADACAEEMVDLYREGI